GEAARAADPAHEHGVLARHADVGQGLLHRRQDGVVAAAGAPPDVLVGGEVLAGELHGAIRGHAILRACAPAPSSSSSTAAITSATLNGWPCTLLSPIASTR